MEKHTSTRIHPLAAAAAISVMLVSLVGIAAITGVLPTSHSSSAPKSALTAPAATDSKSEAQIAANNVVNPEKPAATQTKPQHRTARPVATAQAPICSNCGRIESVQEIKQEAKPTGVGVVAGAVVGGLLGNQVGGGSGKKIATVAGAVGGGYAGNEIEKHTRATISYQVGVRMEDGSLRTFPHSTQPGWGIGDRVRVVDGRLASRG